MLFNLFNKQDNLIGLDIGSYSIKVVELKENNKGLILRNFAIYPLPHEAIIDGAIMNSSAIIEVISQIWHDLRLKNKNVAIGVQGTSVIVKKITIPEQTRAEVEETLKFEAHEHIAFDVEDVKIDFHIASAGPEHGQMDVVLIAAKKEYINEYCSIIGEAGLNPCVIDSSAFAIQNVFERLVGYESGVYSIFINIGDSLTNVNIVSPTGDPFVVRDESIAGKNITDKIAQQLNLSFEDAELLKIGGERGDEEAGMVSHDIADIIQGCAENIAQAVHRSVEYAYSFQLDMSNAKGYLSGGTSLLPQIQSALSTKLNFSLEIFNPFEGIGFDRRKFSEDYLKEMAPFAAVAMGLALRRKNDME